MTLSIDIQDLQQHLTDPRVRTDDQGRVRVSAGGRDLVLGVAQHAADPADCILVLAIYADGPYREVFVRSAEWSSSLAKIGAAVAKPSAVQWIGSARLHHADLTRELHVARELAAVAAHRAWSGSDLRDQDESVIVSQGQGRARAALTISPQLGHEIRIVASLGAHELFAVSTTASEAPSVAVRAVRALDRGEHLSESDAIHAQREGQTTFLDSNGLEVHPGNIWGAGRQHLPPVAAVPTRDGGLFEKLKAGLSRPSEARQ